MTFELAWINISRLLAPLDSPPVRPAGPAPVVPPPGRAMTALWWVPAGHRPSVAEAEECLTNLRADQFVPEGNV